MQPKHFVGDSRTPGGLVIGAIASPLARPELQLTSVIDAAGDAMLVLDARGEILFANRACERMFGHADGQLVGRNIATLMPRDVAERHGAAFAGYFRHAQIEGDVRFLAHDGREISADLSFSAATVGGSEQYLIVARELRASEAERRLLDLQADLMRSARMTAMEEMSGALAHKLNQPLTAVILYLQAIERAYGRETAGGPLPERVVSILEKAVREAERASSMLQRMRQFLEQRDTAPRLVDLNRFVEDAVDLTALTSRPGTRIARLFAPHLPPVMVDAVQLQQALVNLIRGAIDIVRPPDAPGIRVATHRFRDHVAVVVDLGLAVEPGKAGGLGTAATGGSGLSEKDLAISRAIAQDHGGDLLVDTDGHERGTRLTLRLPLPARVATPSA